MEKACKNYDKVCISKNGHNLITLGDKVQFYDLENRDQSGP